MKKYLLLLLIVPYFNICDSVNAQSNVDDNKIEKARRYFDKQMELIGPDGLVWVENIVVWADSTSSKSERKKAKEKIKKIYKEIKNGADFTKTAEKESESPNKTLVISKSYFLKETRDAAFSLKEGQISKIIQTKLGYHIFKVQKKKKHFSFEEEKEKILRDLTICELINKTKERNRNLPHIPNDTTVYRINKKIRILDEVFLFNEVEQKGGLVRKVGIEFKDGTVWIPYDRGYTEIKFNYNGYWTVGRYDDYGICDVTGKEIIPPLYKDVNYTDNSFTYKNMNGGQSPFGISIDNILQDDYIVPKLNIPMYKHIEKDGFTWYEFLQNGMHGAKDINKKVIIQPEYWSINYQDGFFFSTLPHRSALLEISSTDGKIIISRNQKYWLGSIIETHNNRYYFYLFPEHSNGEAYVHDLAGTLLFSVEKNEDVLYYSNAGFYIKSPSGNQYPLDLKLDSKSIAYKEVAKKADTQRKSSKVATSNQPYNMFSGFWDTVNSNLQFQQNMFNNYWNNVNPNMLQQNVPVFSGGGGSLSSGSSVPSQSNSTTSQHDLCNGTGKCNSCNGTGEIWKGFGLTGKMKCPNCNGKGICSGCNGTGRR